MQRRADDDSAEVEEDGAVVMGAGAYRPCNSRQRRVTMPGSRAPWTGPGCVALLEAHARRWPEDEERAARIRRVRRRARRLPSAHLPAGAPDRLGLDPVARPRERAAGAPPEARPLAPARRARRRRGRPVPGRAARGARGDGPRDLHHPARRRSAGAARPRHPRDPRARRGARRICTWTSASSWWRRRARCRSERGVDGGSVGATAAARRFLGRGEPPPHGAADAGGPGARAGAMTACALVLALLAALLAPLAGAAEAPRPNVVLVLVDDAAMMDFGAYGGEARTPNIDALAAAGALFTSYHTSPLCSPSRAMLLTGIDNHRTGVATIEEVLPPEHRGKPGYSLHLEPGVVTVATRLKRAGYRTYMTGKWHLGHGPGDLPNAHGFDRSFALDASGADNWAAEAVHAVLPDGAVVRGREAGGPARGLLLLALLVDRMIDYLDADRVAPFFAYVAFQAVHIPVQAPRELTAGLRGRLRRGMAEAPRGALGPRQGARPDPGRRPPRPDAGAHAPLGCPLGGRAAALREEHGGLLRHARGDGPAPRPPGGAPPRPRRPRPDDLHRHLRQRPGAERSRPRARHERLDGVQRLRLGRRDARRAREPRVHRPRLGGGGVVARPGSSSSPRPRAGSASRSSSRGRASRRRGSMPRPPSSPTWRRPSSTSRASPPRRRTASSP